MNNQTIEVVDENDHLGQIISGDRQESKNIDNRISKSRKALYKLMGPAFAYKCLLSPTLKLHLLKTFIFPVLKSGLSTFVIRKTNLEPIAIFHRKMLKSVLGLIKSTPTPSLHFLTGELTFEGQLHKDVFSIFYSVWANQDSKIFKIIKYLLENSGQTSRTWAVYVRQLCEMYKMEDPLICLQRSPPPKSVYKNYVAAKILSFHESELRQMATQSQSMKYFNVSLLGLQGRCHPAICNVLNTKEVMNMRPHIKVLSGDYLTFEKQSRQSGVSPDCRLCLSGERETICHLATSCFALDTTRQRLMTEIFKYCNTHNILVKQYSGNKEMLTQFLVDPSSMNLPQRVNISDPTLPSLFKIIHDFWNAIHKERMQILKKSA